MPRREIKDVRIITELRRLSDSRKGLLDPRDVVQAARPKSSPLHDYFEWDDSKAAQEHRLWQARQLINVCVHLIPADGEEYKANVFVSLTSDRDKGGYRELLEVLSNKDLRQELLQDALAEMKHFQHKYKELVELAGVIEAMTKAELRLAKEVEIISR